MSEDRPSGTHGAIALALSVLIFGEVRSQRPDVRIDRGPIMTDSVNPRIAASGSAVYVAFEDNRRGGGPNDPGALYLNRSMDGGRTWLAADIRVDSGPGTTVRWGSTRIAATGLAVYVTWEDNRNTGASGAEIFFNRSLDGGRTWLAADVRIDRVNGGPGVGSNPQIAAVGSHVYVAWSDSRNGKRDIYFNRSGDQGSTWLAQDFRVDTDPAGQSSSGPHEIAASGPDVFVVWQDSRPSGVYLNRSLDHGATWLANDRAIGSNRGQRPHLALSGSTVHVAWHEGGQLYSNTSSDRGNTWQPFATAVGVRADVIISTDVTAQGAFVLLASWGMRNGQQGVYANRSLNGGITWLTPAVRIDRGPAGPGPGARPVAASTASTVCVAWTDARNGTGDVYVNRTTDQGASWLASDVRLNTNPMGTGGAARPDLAVSGSSLRVTWTDARNLSQFPYENQVYFNIPFGALRYGTGHAGSGGLVPRLSTTGVATIGDQVNLEVDNGLGGTSAVLLLGTAATSIPLLDGTLLVPPALAVSLPVTGPIGVPGAGTFTFPLGLPDDEALVGAPVFFQALILDPGASAGVAFSNGVELWIG